MFATAPFLAACNYDCPSDGTHCYGTAELAVDQGAGFQGFATQVVAEPLNSGDGELNDELWVTQYKNPQCGDEGNVCWMEVGLTAGAYGLPTNETHLFWADNRPGSGFYFHDYGPLQPQEFDHAVLLLIRPRYLEPNAFDVDALTCANASGSAACPQRWVIGKSTNNKMAAAWIEIGMELTGTHGGNGPITRFDENVVLDPNAPFGGNYLSSEGQLRVNSPIFATWWLPPSAASNGGSFVTVCCQ